MHESIPRGRGNVRIRLAGKKLARDKRSSLLLHCVGDARKSFMKLTADDDDVADFADEKSVDSPTQGQIQKSADARSTDDAGDVQVSTLKKSFYSRH